MKIWPEHFESVKANRKKAELSRDDRQPPFSVGDRLVLQEFEPGRSLYTGRTVVRRVTHVARGGSSIPDGYALLSMAPNGLFA